MSAVMACYVCSSGGLALARRVAAALTNAPRPAPAAVSGPAAASVTPADAVIPSPFGSDKALCRLYAPSRFCPADASPFDSLSALLADTYRRFDAHIFVGAAGIAVRALSPLLAHKSVDPPVLVLDPAGRHVVSLLSGHWGGGNALARRLAALLGAVPVITTASDAAEQGTATGGAGPEQDSTAGRPPEALDLLLRDAGLRLADWPLLPRLQAALLEGRTVRLWDPCGAVPSRPWLERVDTQTDRLAAADPQAEHVAPPRQPEGGLLLAAHYRRLPPAFGRLRVAVPRLYVGLGCRKGIPDLSAADALCSLCARQGLELSAVAGLATVREKLEEPALQQLAALLRVPLRGFDAADLTHCPVPHPSAAAGRRFGLPPFSVCEGAALLAAEAVGGQARLLTPKTIFCAALTLAVALCPPCAAVVGMEEKK